LGSRTHPRRAPEARRPRFEADDPEVHAPGSRSRPWGQSWSTFLRNHLDQVWAGDFLQLYDIWFRPIFAFFIIELGSRKVVQVGVTRNPTSVWAAQQIRNATPFGQGPRFLIRDNDDKFGAEFDRAARGAGIRVVRTAVRAPRMNSFCERFLGSVRRECLDRVVVLGERHLERLLREYCFRISTKRAPIRALVSSSPAARRPRSLAAARS
jgi:transposase InsO family protein